VTAADNPRASAAQLVAVTLLLVALTAAMTWPQFEYLATRAREHQDVYFNMWRLRWFAHALETAPLHIFDGNIFHPEPRTLTYSDAMIVEGLVGAPLLWAGVPPMLVHNVLLLGAIVTSGVGMFVLMQMLTGSAAAGILSAIVFAFVPYRFEHYMHMELQWTMWMPWSFWALHRTLATRSWRHGFLTGLFLSLQMLSSIYYGVFLSTLLGVCAVLLLIAQPSKLLWPSIKALLPGALLAVVICGAYALPYLETKSATGGRSEVELMAFSARPSSYLVATPDNVLWGRAFASRGRLERRLFPGVLVVILAMVGLLLRPPPKVALVYLVALVMSFDMSLGLSGHIYRLLYEHVPFYQGLRALARLGIFVVFFLAALAAYGYVALAELLPSKARLALAVGLGALLLLEYRVRPLELVPYPNSPPPLYAWLSTQPRGVVAELPMRASGLPGSDPAYSYLSTFHWMPIVNGYSGFYPASYLGRLDDLAAFPDEKSINRLRRDGVRYVVVHLIEIEPARREAVLDALRNGFGFAELTRQSDGRGEAAVFALR
jgi:hypothetical protein